MLFGFKENKCKGKVYTQEEVDNLLKNKSDTGHTHAEIENILANKSDKDHTHTEYKVKDDFAVVTGTIDLTSGSGQTTNNYPDGFARDNCVVISSAIQFNDGIPCTEGVSVVLAGNTIQLSSNYTDGPTGTRNYKIVLMKI